MCERESGPLHGAGGESVLATNPTLRPLQAKTRESSVLLQQKKRHSRSFKHVPTMGLIIRRGWQYICILIKINESCMIQWAILAVGRGAKRRLPY